MRGRQPEFVGEITTWGVSDGLGTRVLRSRSSPSTRVVAMCGIWPPVQCTGLCATFKTLRLFKHAGTAPRSDAGRCCRVDLCMDWNMCSSASAKQACVARPQSHVLDLCRPVLFACTLFTSNFQPDASTLSWKARRGTIYL